MKHYNFEISAIRLAGLAATSEFLEPVFSNRNREILVVAMCDDNLLLTGLLIIPGNEEHVLLPMQKVMRTAVRCGCKGIVIAHNHPSGDLNPSKSDVELTKRLVIATESIGVEMLDHLIFTCGQPFSFRHHGLI